LRFLFIRAISINKVVFGGKKLQKFRYHALILTVLLAISALGVGEYYCDVEIKDPVKGIDVLVEDCSNIGTFSIGGIYDGQWERLTYNYPMPWRGTFISVKVGDKIYSNSVQPKGKISLDEYVVQYPRVEGNAIITRWELPENLALEQKIEVLDNIARIRIKVTNSDSSSLSAGVRLHLDTMLGYNDGPPIYIYGEGLQSYEKEYLESEMGFKYWEAYDLEENPDIVSTGAIKNEDLTYTAPSSLILANWKTSMRSAWDYSADNSIPITGDSAVIMYYPEELLLPGESREVVFGYGRGEGAKETEPVTTIPTTVPETGSPTTLPVSNELVISSVVADRQDSYCPGDSVTIGVNLENGNEENSGTIKVEIKDNEGKTLFIERKETGVLNPGWAGAVRFTWEAVDVGLKDFTVTATLHDSENRETDRKTATIRIDRLSCPQEAIAMNPFFLGLLLALILIVLAYIIYTKMPHGRVELKKLKEGELSKIVVWNKTNHVIRKCVLHDKLVKGAEVSVSTINVHRHGNSLTWNLGSLKSGEKAVLEYTIKGANVLPKATLSWEGGEVESS